MKVIAFEEHYKIPAIAQANKANPIEQIYDTWNKLGRFPGDPSKGVPPDIYDLDEKRIAAMDAAGIDVQILSHTVPGPEELEPKLAIELARKANEAAHATVTRFPDRFRAFAALPMLDPKAAADELERTVHKLGFVGALINGHVNGRYLDDKFFWPVFECAEKLNVPIYLHPNRPPQPVVSACYDGFNPIVSGFLALAGLGWHIDTGHSRHATDSWRGIRRISWFADYRRAQFRDPQLDRMARDIRVPAERYRSQAPCN
ncbi:MAG TPA: amidohydrolase family protein [Acidobacteriaceae bacterium]|nr:amidohydrolase family protein [Acidobacteriaceae bacterium]